MVVGVVCAVAMAVLTGSRSGSDVIPLGSIRSVDPAPTPGRLGSGERVTRDGPMQVTVYPAGIDHVRPAPPMPIPRRVRIEAIGLDAPIVPVGVANGTTQVPSDVDDVGWYRFGPTPGGPGSSVLLSHVDSKSQGHGAFFHLRELVPGDVISVEFDGGKRRSFEVVARRQYLKEHLPDAVFRRSGRPVLTLVTCGGTFDLSSLHYTDNVVIYAVPMAHGSGSDAT